MVRALLARDGALPVNLKLLVEGEEEIGSPNFESLLVRERERLAADVVVVSDTAMWAPDVPSMCTGMRGLVAFSLELRTATVDLHSGSFGGAVRNAAHVAAELVTALHDAEGHVTMPGFYDAVRPVTDDVDYSVTAVGGVAPALTPLDHPAVAAAARAIERVWDAPCRFTREGGSGPEESLGRVLEAPVVFLGVGLPDDQIHAPNERIVLDQLWKGLLAIGELWRELATVGASFVRPPSTGAA